MHRSLLLLTSATAALAAATSASAQTTIDDKRTSAVRTSKVKGGARDDISITSSGSVVTSGGVAVTIDSDNKVTNAGTVQVTDANDATGILAQSGTSGSITNSGKIIVDETYAPADDDKDGDLDGPFASGSRRAGIRTAGAFAGSIANSGEITVEGNDSHGILLGGPLAGSLSSTGKVAVTGDRSAGVRAGAVSGDVTLGGAITAVGRDAVGARFDGNIGGTLLVEGQIGATGYRYTTAPASTSKLDADDLLQGGPALMVAGSVANGITLSGASGKVADVASFGAAPALLIGASDRAITIGTVSGSSPSAGLVVNGKVTAAGVYSGVTGTAISIGGLGGAVTVDGGVTVGGTVQAGASGASATAMRFGAGAKTPEIRVGGSVSASASGSGSIASGLLLEAGSEVPTIRVTGSVKSAASDATAIAILDKSGKLTLVENTGAIAGAGAESERSIAIDLTANSAGATVRQAAPASGSTAPTITGAIRFGAGSDRLEVAAGSVSGDATFGSGADLLDLTGTGIFAGTAAFGSGDDVLALDGTARFQGVADFAGGGTDVLRITGKGVFAGRLANASGVAVSVAAGGGTFAFEGAATIASLSLGAESTLSVALDRANPTGNLLQVTGATTISADSKLVLRVAGGADPTGRYVVLRSGTLTGASNLTLAPAAVPFLYKGSLVEAAANEIAVEVTRKAAGELGLNRAGTSAFNAIDAAIANDAKVATSIRGIYEGAAFAAAVDQFLPNYAGGVFEGVTLGSRAAASQLAEPAGEFSEEGSWGYWLAPVGWDASKARRATESYDVRGWGIGGGVEHKTAAGNFGASLTYLTGRDSEGVAVNRVEHDQYELAGHWRGRWGGLAVQARASAAFVTFDSVRQFDGTVGTEKVQRRATADWNGMLYSGTASASYEFLTGQISLRPVVSLEYHRLSEDAYRETGGGSAFDLTVRRRRSDELAATVSLAAGINFGGSNRYAQWSRIEVEGGRRMRLGGALGRTTASFGDGDEFTLEPERRGDGWVGRVRAITGTSEIRLSGEARAEQRLGDVALSARAALQFAF